MIMVDTDVLIWNLRGHEGAAERLDSERGFLVSAVTYIELLQGLRDHGELRTLRRALRFWEARIHQINESTSMRAIFLVEEHGLAHGMQMADALIAATALDLGATLLTANDRHYRPVAGLELEVFRPGA